MSRSSQVQKDAPPPLVGPYVIQSKLGAGGMGEVYRAWDTRLERAVAVKKVLIKSSRKDRGRERLRHEARAIASLSHPAVVGVFDFLETEDGDWIVMELVEGRTLRSLIHTRELQEAEVIALAREITEGLAAAHAKGLVHRDLKSENVMVTHLGHVKILDFGLAQPYEGERRGPSEDGLTPRSRVVGTSRAMSPEQAKGLAVDPRSDLFSLGSLLFEMVTGESPFHGPSAYVTMTRVCYHRQRPAREVHPAVSAELSNFIDHLLEKDPDRRPQSAAEVSAVLDSLAGIAPLPPSLVHLLWPTESFEMDSAALSDSTAGVPRFLPKSLLSPDELRSSIFIWTVLAAELTNAAELLRRCGDEGASRIFLAFDRCVRDLLVDFSGFEIEKADTFSLLFRRPVDAVRYAIALGPCLAPLSVTLGVELETRVGIHVGELQLRENPPEDVERGAKRFEAKGRTKHVAARVMQQARPGQVLITQGVYEMARPAKLDLADPDRRVQWREHSRITVPSLDEPVQIFEIVVGDDEAAAEEEEEADAATSRWRWVAIAALVLLLLAVVAGVLRADETLPQEIAAELDAAGVNAWP